MTLHPLCVGCACDVLPKRSVWKGGGSTVEEPNKHDLSQVIKVNIDTDNYIDVMLPLIYGEKET